MKKWDWAAACLTVGLIVNQDAWAEVDKKSLLANYADIAAATYGDSLATAKDLKTAVEKLVKNPSDDNLRAARSKWLAARVPYQQSEAFRFGNPVVDEWEGKVNAWPLDEGLIDYVNSDSYGTESGENPLYTANVIANAEILINGKKIDARNITPALLEENLQEAGKIESNVATGYHAIEFLLWGQDLNGTEAGAGNRPYTDYDLKNCTNGHCDRRAAYLLAASALLVSDLSYMAEQWSTAGAARKELLAQDHNLGLARIINGLGSLSYGELAGERMKLGLMLHDPEEEHDCFSDNTHNSHYYDALGIRNIYQGEYRRIDGTEVKGPSLSDLVRSRDENLDQEMLSKLEATEKAMMAIVSSAEKGVAYDQLIGAGNQQGNAIVQAAIDALVAQTKVLEKVIPLLGLKEIAFEGSDSLDNPEKVAQ